MFAQDMNFTVVTTSDCLWRTYVIFELEDGTTYEGWHNDWNYNHQDSTMWIGVQYNGDTENVWPEEPRTVHYKVEATRISDGEVMSITLPLGIEPKKRVYILPI